MFLSNVSSTVVTGQVKQNVKNVKRGHGLPLTGSAIQNGLVALGTAILGILLAGISVFRKRN